MELKLGSQACILGVIDAELRPVRQIPDARLPPSLSPVPSPRLVSRPPQSRAGLPELLQSSRLRAGLSFREASALSRWIASRLSDELYFAAASTLSDYETLSVPPRHIQKLITLCVLYSIGFAEFLRSCGIPLDPAGGEPIPDELVPRAAPRASPCLSPACAGEGLLPANGFFGSLVRQWEEIPLFLRHALADLTGLKNFSLSDVFWVGGNRTPRHPWLVHAALVAVNRRIKKPVPSPTTTFCQRPLYLLVERDGRYLCGPCSSEDGNLVVPAYPGEPDGARHFRSGVDAEVIGQVTAILRRLC